MFSVIISKFNWFKVYSLISKDWLRWVTFSVIPNNCFGFINFDSTLIPLIFLDSKFHISLNSLLRTSILHDQFNVISCEDNHIEELRGLFSEDSSNFSDFFKSEIKVKDSIITHFVFQKSMSTHLIISFATCFTKLDHSFCSSTIAFKAPFRFTSS